MDYTTMTDTELEAVINDMRAEQERRSRTLSIPGEIERMTRQFVADGGDPAHLVECVTDPADPIADATGTIAGSADGLKGGIL